jgi:hypothetical protein
MVTQWSLRGRPCRDCQSSPERSHTRPRLRRADRPPVGCAVATRARRECLAHAQRDLFLIAVVSDAELLASVAGGTGVATAPLDGWVARNASAGQWRGFTDADATAGAYARSMTWTVAASASDCLSRSRCLPWWRMPRLWAPLAAAICVCLVGCGESGTAQTGGSASAAKIAFVRGDDEGVGIVVMDADGDNQSQLTDHNRLISGLVAGSHPDRVHQLPRHWQVGLRHERGRQRSHEPDALHQSRR